jgi:hypothetical protein
MYKKQCNILILKENPRDFIQSHANATQNIPV